MSADLTDHILRELIGCTGDVELAHRRLNAQGHKVEVETVAQARRRLSEWTAMAGQSGEPAGVPFPYSQQMWPLPGPFIEDVHVLNPAAGKSTTLTCLLDSGAVGTNFPPEVAAPLGIDLAKCDSVYGTKRGPDDWDVVIYRHPIILRIGALPGMELSSVRFEDRLYCPVLGLDFMQPFRVTFDGPRQVAHLALA